ncbi:MAG: hypothetical protein HYR91_03520 [Flavobacteriia bacterium]|nr:hypothetical protein [Flavobacteriia bacterium]
MRNIITLFFILGDFFLFSQDSCKFVINIEPTVEFSTVFISLSSLSFDYSIIHSPTREDSITIQKYSKLITTEPTQKNHSNYYSLACSYWQVGKLTEAEKIFLKIVASNEPYYIQNYSFSSDIAGKTTNTYGYGSYTTNYKNYACRYLTKIYIENKNYDLALQYLMYADNKFTVVQNCGTGYQWYRDEIDGLYGLIYEGLGENKQIIDLFLPQYSKHSNGILTRAIKKEYSQKEIVEFLTIAENSIIYVADTFQTASFITYNDDENKETTIESKYISGSATITLFGRQITMPSAPLENGEIISKELFLKEFKTSNFYITLIE